MQRCHSINSTLLSFDSRYQTAGVTKKGILAALLPSGNDSSKLPDDSSATFSAGSRTGGDYLVNQQLQTVVEDTLLKNIHYKVVVCFGQQMFLLVIITRIDGMASWCQTFSHQFGRWWLMLHWFWSNTTFYRRDFVSNVNNKFWMYHSSILMMRKHRAKI